MPLRLLIFRFKKNEKVGLSCVGKMYRVTALLTNSHTCPYGNNYLDFSNIRLAGPLLILTFLKETQEHKFVDIHRVKKKPAH